MGKRIQPGHQCLGYKQRLDNELDVCTCKRLQPGYQCLGHRECGSHGADVLPSLELLPDAVLGS
eukprot:4922328-Alexandrium_andersonii.AAC.1